MGDATSGSTTARADSKRPAVRRRAVGTRERIAAHLVEVGEIADPTGMASTKLAEAVGYPGSSVAFAQLLSGMERDGLISREVRGKLTYRITLRDAGRPRPPAARRRVTVAPVIPDAAPAGADVTNGLAAGVTADPRSASTPAGFPAEFDYDELARRLLIQVLRRLTATPADLEETVAGLERELATARTRHGTLTAENVRLREQLSQAQRDLDLARRHNATA